jgi:hypothetical protein
MSYYKSEFRNYDDTLTLPEGWVDVSWHNDACPSFQKAFGNVTFRIFCDYKDPDQREMQGAMRFVIYIEDEVNYVCIGQTDTIKEALDLVNEEVNK